MKKLLRVSIASLFTLISVSFYSCEEMSVSERAQQAADEFCDCYNSSTGTLSKCEKEFQKEYGTSHSDEFLKEFNVRAKKCGVELIREKTNYSNAFLKGLE